MDRFDVLNCLHFKQNQIVDQKVCSVHHAERAALVEALDWHFSRKGKTSKSQLDFHRCHISGFEQTRAKGLVNGDGRVDKLCRDFIHRHFATFAFFAPLR